MKMTDDLEKAFNEQITLEFEASMVYRQLAIEMEIRDLPGIASWLRHQADEEIVHANKLIDHVAARGNHPIIGSINPPRAEIDSVFACFEAAGAHERRNSEAIRSLYRVAEAASDLDSRPLLSWFLAEQVEEESTLSEIAGRIRMIDDDGPGLLRLDGELGARPVASTESTTAPGA